MFCGVVWSMCCKSARVNQVLHSQYATPPGIVQFFGLSVLHLEIYIQSVPLATEPGVSLITLTPMSGRKWWPLPAHVMVSHFLHNEVSPLQIS